VGAALLAPPPHLRELRRGLAGDVLTATSPGYDRARLLYSPRFDSVHPEAVVLAETEEAADELVAAGVGPAAIPARSPKICPSCTERYGSDESFCGRDGSELVTVN